MSACAGGGERSLAFSPVMVWDQPGLTVWAFGRGRQVLWGLCADPPQGHPAGPGMGGGHHGGRGAALGDGGHQPPVRSPAGIGA